MQFSSWKIGFGVVMVLALAGAIVFGSTRQGLVIPTAWGEDPARVFGSTPMALDSGYPLMSEQERLQGAWRLVSQEMDGEAVADSGDIVIVFAGRRFLQARRTGLAEGAYNLVPDTNPKRIDLQDFKQTEGSGAAKAKSISFAFYGIYKLDGDRLTICFGPEHRAPAPAGGVRHREGLRLQTLRAEARVRGHSKAPEPS